MIDHINQLLSIFDDDCEVTLKLVYIIDHVAQLLSDVINYVTL